MHPHSPARVGKLGSLSICSTPHQWRLPQGHEIPTFPGTPVFRLGTGPVAAGEHGAGIQAGQPPGGTSVCLEKALVLPSTGGVSLLSAPPNDISAAPVPNAGSRASSCHWACLEWAWDLHLVPLMCTPRWRSMVSGASCQAGTCVVGLSLWPSQGPAHTRTSPLRLRLLRKCQQEGKAEHPVRTRFPA